MEVPYKTTQYHIGGSLLKGSPNKVPLFCGNSQMEARLILRLLELLGTPGRSDLK